MDFRGEDLNKAMSSMVSLATKVTLKVRRGDLQTRNHEESVSCETKPTKSRSRRRQISELQGIPALWLYGPGRGWTGAGPGPRWPLWSTSARRTWSGSRTLLTSSNTTGLTEKMVATEDRTGELKLPHLRPAGRKLPRLRSEMPRSGPGTLQEGGRWQMVTPTR